MRQQKLTAFTVALPIVRFVFLAGLSVAVFAPSRVNAQDGVIYGCIAADRTIHIADATGACKKNEVRLQLERRWTAGIERRPRRSGGQG